MNWNDPAARLALLEQVGPAEYNRQINAWIDANPIRPTPSPYGTIYAVGRTGYAFATRSQAEEYLATIK